MIAAIYLLLATLLWAGQELLLFPALLSFRSEDATQAPQGVTVVDLDGAPLWIRGEADRVVLFAHGNGEWIGQLDAYADAVQAAGWSFAAVEFRGVAGTPGWARQAVLTPDFVAAIDALVARGTPLSRIVVHGRSIGGGVVGQALAQRQPAGVVFESTFDSLGAVVRTRPIVRYFPISWLLRSPFPTAETVAPLRIPAFQVHDTTDSLIHFDRAEVLRDALHDVEFHATTGHRHGAALVLRDASTRAAWLAWLDRTVPPSPTAAPSEG